MVEQRWFSLCTSTSSSLYRHLLMLIAAALFLGLTQPVPVVATTTTSRLTGLALREATEQNQLDRHMPEPQPLEVTENSWWLQRQRGRWFSISDDDTATHGDKERRSRRRLIGSSPLSCRFRCGRCTPCLAVAVPIQPWRIRPLEYYPEAWRCQCGNKLFIP